MMNKDLKHKKGDRIEYCALPTLTPFFDAPNYPIDGLFIYKTMARAATAAAPDMPTLTAAPPLE